MILFNQDSDRRPTTIVRQLFQRASSRISSLALSCSWAGSENCVLTRSPAIPLGAVCLAPNSMQAPLSFWRSQSIVVDLDGAEHRVASPYLDSRHRRTPSRWVAVAAGNEQDRLGSRVGALRPWQRSPPRLLTMATHQRLGAIDSGLAWSSRHQSLFAAIFVPYCALFCPPFMCGQ